MRALPQLQGLALVHAGPLARRSAPRPPLPASPHGARRGARHARRRVCVAAAGEEADVAVFRFTLARAPAPAAQRRPGTPRRVYSAELTRSITRQRQGIPGFDDALIPRARAPGCRASTRARARCVLNAVACRAAGHWHRWRPAACREPRAWRHRRRRAGAPLWTRGGSLAPLSLIRCAFCAQTRTEALGLLLGALCFALPTIGERLEEVSAATPLLELRCTTADASSTRPEAACAQMPALVTQSRCALVIAAREARAARLRL